MQIAAEIAATRRLRFILSPWLRYGSCSRNVGAGFERDVAKPFMPGNDPVAKQLPVSEYLVAGL
jgi:hypothetical protein